MLSEIALREVLVSPESLYGVPKVPPVWTYIVALHRRRRCQTSRLCHTSGQMLGPQNQPPVPALRANAPADPPPRRGVANTGRGGGRRTEGSAEEAAFSFPRGHRRMRVCEVPSGKRAGWQRPRASRRALRGGSPRGFSSSCSFREPDCVPEAMLTSGLLTFGARAQGFRPLPVLSRMVGPGGKPPLPPPAKWTRLELASQSLALSHFLSNHTRLLTWPFSFSNPGFNCSNLKN